MGLLFRFVFLVLALGLGFESVVSQSIMASDLFNTDGTLNSEKYEFVHGKYFLKDSAKGGLINTFAASAQTYSQCLDHTTSCTTTWPQRYWTNDAYYRTGGPIFYFIGAEGPMDGCSDNYSWQYLWWGAAVGAKFVCIEHRYYGSSYPTNDQSEAGLKLLTSQQALADYIQFIRWFKTQQRIPTAKVVVFGGSYGGNLAAWIRELYPNDINVAVSSSGPLNATFDMFQYVQTVSEVIYYTNSSCYNALGDIFYCMQNVAAGYNGCSNSVMDKSKLPGAVNYCYSVDFNNPSQSQNFWVSTAFSIWASNYPQTQDSPQCQKLLARYNTMSDPIAAYGQFLKDIGKSWGSCSNSGRKKRATFGSMSAATDSKSWIWQTCNEFGYYQSSDPTYSLFGSNTWSASFWSNNCRYYWGNGQTDSVIQAKIQNSVNYYKGQSFTGTCTIFVNGAYDPWHKLGIYQAGQTSSSNSVVLIPTGEHCSDMSHGGSADVTKAQTQIGNLINQYLANPNC